MCRNGAVVRGCESRRVAVMRECSPLTRPARRPFVKVVPKLAITLFAGVFVVVGVFTALRVQSEISAFDQDVRRDQRVVGVTAGAALARTRTREDAIRLAARVDAS